MVTSDDAITYTHLARDGFPAVVLDVLNRETSSIATGPITIDGTKLNINLAAKIGDAATLAAKSSSDCIARDGAVGEGECAAVVRDGAAAVSDDAAAFRGSSIARDGAVGEGKRAEVGDAATPI